MGFDAIVGLAIVAVGAGMGYSGAMINPFTVGVAQGIAGVAPASGVLFRLFCHLCMIAVASVLIIRYALKVQADPTKSLVYGDTLSAQMSEEDVQNAPSASGKSWCCSSCCAASSWWSSAVSSTAGTSPNWLPSS